MGSLPYKVYCFDVSNYFDMLYIQLLWDGLGFIHSGDLYRASSRHYYSEALPAQSQPKKKDFRDIYVKFGRAGHQQGTQLYGDIIPCWWAHNRKGPSLHGS